EDLRYARFFLFDYGSQNDLSIQQDCQINHEASRENKNKPFPAIALFTSITDLERLQLYGPRELTHRPHVNVCTRQPFRAHRVTDALFDATFCKYITCVSTKELGPFILQQVRGQNQIAI